MKSSRYQTVGNLFCVMAISSFVQGLYLPIAIIIGDRFIIWSEVVLFIAVVACFGGLVFAQLLLCLHVRKGKDLTIARWFLICALPFVFGEISMPFAVWFRRLSPGAWLVPLIAALTIHGIFVSPR